MKKSIKDEVAKILNEIIEDSQSEINKSNDSENITLSELKKANDRILKNQEKLYNLYSKYPELGDANKVKPDGSFFEKALSVYGQRHMKSLSEDLKRYQKNHEEYEQQKLFNTMKSAFIEAINETKTNSSNSLHQIAIKKIAEDKTDQSILLADVFESISKYKHIMEILVKKQFCQPNTYIWKDEKKGSKGLSVAILKHLHSQGYYKNNKKLSNKQIKEISQNTFGLEIGIDTIKSSNTENFIIDFIPIATTLDLSDK